MVVTIFIRVVEICSGSGLILEVSVSRLSFDAGNEFRYSIQVMSVKLSFVVAELDVERSKVVLVVMVDAVVVVLDVVVVVAGRLVTLEEVPAVVLVIVV